MEESARKPPMSPEDNFESIAYWSMRFVFISARDQIPQRWRKRQVKWLLVPCNKIIRENTLKIERNDCRIFEVSLTHDQPIHGAKQCSAFIHTAVKMIQKVSTFYFVEFWTLLSLLFVVISNTTCVKCCAPQEGAFSLRITFVQQLCGLPLCDATLMYLLRTVELRPYSRVVVGMKVDRQKFLKINLYLTQQIQIFMLMYRITCPCN